MGINRSKKEYDYFGCFCEVGELADKAAAYLLEIIENFSYGRINEYTEEMHVFEHDADSKKHELCGYLAHEFMPPIEREDISLLSQELDNVVDSVEDVMRKIYMYNIRQIRGEAVEFAKLLAETCSLFNKLIIEFANFKKSKTIHGYIIEINTLENRGDRLHAESIRSLFASENITAVEQFSWTVIFESLENSLDACENVADIIENIITKNT